jgi:hypothetical protein
MQQSISFGDSSGKVAAAAAAAQRAMQEQELAELVSLGFDEADAKVGSQFEGVGFRGLSLRARGAGVPGLQRGRRQGGARFEGLRRALDPGRCAVPSPSS